MRLLLLSLKQPRYCACCGAFVGAGVGAGVGEGVNAFPLTAQAETADDPPHFVDLSPGQDFVQPLQAPCVLVLHVVLVQRHLFGVEGSEALVHARHEAGLFCACRTVNGFVHQHTQSYD